MGSPNSGATLFFKKRNNMERQEENWKDIEGFEGLYEVSDKGRVYSYYSQRIKSPGKTQDGYYALNLWKNKKQFTIKIHRLVAEHFISNFEGYREINHIDKDKYNNTVENLEWVTRQYNNEFSKAGHYVLYGPNDERCEIFNLAKFARDNGIDNRPLFAVVKGKQKSYKGYTREPGTKYTTKRMGSFRLISPEEEVFTFKSQKEAAEYLKCNNRSIGKLLKGNVKSCKGWRLHPLEGIFAFT